MEEKGLNCQFCNKVLKNKMALVKHESLCKNNPNRRPLSPMCRKGHPNYGNHFTKAKELGLPQPVVSDETRKKLSEAGKGRKWSEEGKKKISDKLKQYYKEHPDEVPFKLHHSSKPSYPEEYFRNVFEKENIDLKYHLQVDRYELDFYNISLKKYVEIDGNYHDSTYMINHDIVRENYLKELGWEGIRITWREYQKLSHDEKCKVVENIRNFLTAENKYTSQAKIEQIYISYKDKKDKERKQRVKEYKEKQLEHKKHMREILIKCCETSNIDFTKRGWVTKCYNWLIDNTDKRFTHIDALFKRYYPEFYELYNPYKFKK